MDTEPLGEYDEGEERHFTAEPLVFSPIGDYIRAWWEGTASKLGMTMNQQADDPRYMSVLNQFGLLGWRLQPSHQPSHQP